MRAFESLMCEQGLRGRRRSSTDRPPVHMGNGPKFKLRPFMSWTDSDARPRLSFWRWTAHLMDEFEGRTIKKLSVNGRTDGPFTSCTDSDDGILDGSLKYSNMDGGGQPDKWTKWCEQVSQDFYVTSLPRFSKFWRGRFFEISEGNDFVTIICH